MRVAMLAMSLALLLTGCSKEPTPVAQSNCSCSATMKNCTCDHCSGKSQTCPCKSAKPATGGNRDPICGMKENLTKLSTYEGKEFAFCSDKCKATFDAKPAEYKWGYCPCKASMPGCGCGHCKKNSEPCECEDEKK